MRAMAYIWGVGGVLVLLGFAVYRLAPQAFSLLDIPLSLFHWAALIFSVVYMAYAEGYKGFHLAFAPRVVARAGYLYQNPRVDHILLAPLFCMGYIHATRKRQLVSIGLTLLIVGFVFVARQLPQPWRGILDAGVVVGLTLGMSSIVYFLINRHRKSAESFALIEVPVKV